jgi:hypothetical protein
MQPTTNKTQQRQQQTLHNLRSNRRKAASNRVKKLHSMKTFKASSKSLLVVLFGAATVSVGTAFAPSIILSNNNINTSVSNNQLSKTTTRTTTTTTTTTASTTMKASSSSADQDEAKKICPLLPPPADPHTTFEAAMG